MKIKGNGCKELKYFCQPVNKYWLLRVISDVRYNECDYNSNLLDVEDISYVNIFFFLIIPFIYKMVKIKMVIKW